MNTQSRLWPYLIPPLLILGVFLFLKLFKSIYNQKHIKPLQELKSTLKTKKHTQCIVAITNTEFSDALIQKTNNFYIKTNQDLSDLFFTLEQNKPDFAIFLGVKDDWYDKAINVFGLFFLDFEIIINEHYKMILFKNYTPSIPVNIFSIEDYNLQRDSNQFLIKEDNEYFFNFSFLPQKQYINVVSIEIKEANFNKKNIKMVASYKTKNSKDFREEMVLTQGISEDKYFILKKAENIDSINLFIWNPQKEKLFISCPKIKTYVSRETINKLTSDIDH
ncbi:MAG: hypothetical protein HUU48_01195 [Flavobacteriales bacterium]|nr:hypothetical protein [Flavobacteriales bacterium]